MSAASNSPSSALLRQKRLCPILEVGTFVVVRLSVTVPSPSLLLPVEQSLPDRSSATIKESISLDQGRRSVVQLQSLPTTLFCSRIHGG
jgi:hypothetical protein